jgi:uncharacterized tellurite resistance protein B-like protein
MEPIENLYYALGQLAYAIARADGNIQPEEKLALQAILAEETRDHGVDFDNAEIVFNLMERDETDALKSYEWAMNELKRNSHYFIPAIRDKFVQALERIARAYPPLVPEEKRLLERFKKEVREV